MSGRKSKHGIVLASLLGLVAVAIIGAWVLTQSSGEKPGPRASKPIVETRR